MRIALLAEKLATSVMYAKASRSMIRLKNALIIDRDFSMDDWTGEPGPDLAWLWPSAHDEGTFGREDRA